MMVLIFDEMGKIMKTKTSNGTFFNSYPSKIQRRKPKRKLGLLRPNIANVWGTKLFLKGGGVNF